MQCYMFMQVTRLPAAEERHQQAVLAVLYHLSVDDKCKSMFTYTDCIPTVSFVALMMFALSLQLSLSFIMFFIILTFSLSFIVFFYDLNSCCLLIYSYISAHWCAYYTSFVHPYSCLCEVFIRTIMSSLCNVHLLSRCSDEEMHYNSCIYRLWSWCWIPLSLWCPWSWWHWQWILLPTNVMPSWSVRAPAWSSWWNAFSNTVILSLPRWSATLPSMKDPPGHSSL